MTTCKAPRAFLLLTSLILCLATACTPAHVRLRQAGLDRLGAGDRPGAARLFEQALEAEPGDPAARRELAALALDEGRDRQAAWLLDGICDKTADPAGCLLDAARAYRRLDEPAAALSLLVEAAWRLPPGARRDGVLSEAAGLLSRVGPGGYMVDLALELASDFRASPSLQFRAALLAMRAGRDAEACPLLGRALAAVPDDLNTRLNLAWCRHRTGDRDGAKAEAERLAVAYPDGTGVALLQAGLALASGENSFAAERYRSALTQTSDPRVRALYAVALARIGRFEQARPEVEAALAAGAGGPESDCPFGLVLLETGDPASAAPLLERGAAAGGGCDRAAGMALLRSGRPVGAVARFETALAVDPTDDGVRRLLAEALVGAGDPDRAAGLLGGRGASAADRLALADLLSGLPERSAQAAILYDELSGDPALAGRACYGLAALAARAGDAARAVELLGRARDGGHPGIEGVMADPRFGRVADLPAFQSGLRRLIDGRRR